MWETQTRAFDRWWVRGRCWLQMQRGMPWGCSTGRSLESFQQETASRCSSWRGRAGLGSYVYQPERLTWSVTPSELPGSIIQTSGMSQEFCSVRSGKVLRGFKVLRSMRMNWEPGQTTGWIHVGSHRLGAQDHGVAKAPAVGQPVGVFEKEQMIQRIKRPST